MNWYSSCKRKVQNNKQMIAALHHKTSEVDGNLYRLEQKDDVMSARWTEEELLLGVQGDETGYLNMFLLFQSFRC